jgi:hypothetical protein
MTGHQYNNKYTQGAIIRCARYAFAPNYYHYCGPDQNRTILDYINDSAVDEGLIREIKEFHVLYPYLNHIAHANKLKDPFDPRVVDAYWIGNSLLDQIPVTQTIHHVTIDQNLKSKISKKAMKWIVDTIPKGAKLHHSFHVFTVFHRSGHAMVDHTVETMNECRIGWGKVISKIKDQKSTRSTPRSEDRGMLRVDTERRFFHRAKARSLASSNVSKIQIKSQKLIFEHGKLIFIPTDREVNIPFGDKVQYSEGDWVTFHWGMVCEKVKESAVKRLSGITKYNLRIANEII